MEYVNLGTISGSFGLDGTLKVISSTMFQEERYQKGNKVFLYNPNTKERTELTVDSYRISGKMDYVKVEEITVKEDADKLKGYQLHAIKDDIELYKGEYYYSDLENLDVYDEQDNLLGKVKKVEEFPAQITLRVSRKNKPDFFVPFLEQFIINVDLKTSKIVIKVIGGMLWE